MKQLRGTIRSFFCENKQLHGLLKYFLKFSPCPCFFVFPKVGLFRFGVLGSHTGSLWSGLHFYIGSEITQKRQIPLLVVGGTSQNMVLFGCKSRMVKHVNSITLIPCIAIGDVHPKSYGAKNQQTYFVCKESHTKEGQEKPIKFIWRFKFPTSFGLTFEIVDHQKLGGGYMHHASPKPLFLSTFFQASATCTLLKVGLFKPGPKKLCWRRWQAELAHIQWKLVRKPKSCILPGRDTHPMVGIHGTGKKKSSQWMIMNGWFFKVQM